MEFNFEGHDDLGENFEDKFIIFKNWKDTMHQMPRVLKSQKPQYENGLINFVFHL